jgi:hypothetical protein
LAASASVLLRVLEAIAAGLLVGIPRLLEVVLLRRRWYLILRPLGVDLLLAALGGGLDKGLAEARDDLAQEACTRRVLVSLVRVLVVLLLLASILHQGVVRVEVLWVLDDLVCAELLVELRQGLLSALLLGVVQEVLLSERLL